MSEIAAKLREYNRWRRGDEEIAQPDPGEIGRLLDAVCEMVEQLERERDMAEDERIDLAKQLRSEQERHAVCQNERDEVREDAAHWKIEYEIVVARLCGKRRQRDNGIVSDDEVIPKLIRALKWIAERYDDSKPMHQVAMDAYQMSCTARAVLQKKETK